MLSLIKLAAVFFKVGLFTFGGGGAMMPLLQEEFVRKRRFLTDEELLDMYSIGQCTPGIIAINVATFIGYRQRGTAGAIVSTVGMVLPSLLVIMLIATVFERYMHERYVAYAFAGVRVGATVLIADVILNLWRKNIGNLQEVLVFAGALVLAVGFKVGAAWIVLAAALTALISGELKKSKK